MQFLPNLLTWQSLRLAILAILMAALPGGAALADIISIPGASFVQHCPCPPGGHSGTVDRGVLVTDDQATYFAEVQFPVNGNKICSFSMIYQDINGNDTMTARLLRKSFAVGGNVFSNPAVIAKVGSAAGVVDTVRKATATLGVPPSINDNSAFYYVEVDMPTINLNLIGVQIDHRTACP
jgi:hypothetical protein